MKKAVLFIAFIVAWAAFIIFLWITFPVWAIVALVVCRDPKQDSDAQHRMKYFSYENQNF